MSYQLTIEPLGQTLDVEEGQTILDAALRAGLYIPHACCHGLCATCKIQVTDGEIDHGEASNFALMDYEREEGKCLACCATLESDVVIEAEIEEEVDAQNLPVHDYTATVSRIENLTPTIKGVWLKLPEGQKIAFQAGQYINLNIPGETASRAFSIASAPQDSNEIELNIRQVVGGRGTGWVHEQLKQGDTVTFSGPYGRFFVRKSESQPSLFLAGGSGLSSPRSMILDLLAGLPAAYVWGNCDYSRGELDRYATALGIRCCGPMGRLELGGKHIAFLHGDNPRDFARLFMEDEVPWEELAFATVTETLGRFFADRRKGSFAMHDVDIVLPPK